MRIALLMHRGSAHGCAILRALAARRRLVHRVVTVSGPSAWTNLRRTVHAEGACATGARIVRRTAGKLLDALVDRPNTFDPDLTPQVHRWRQGDRTNGPATIAALRAAEPDLLLLGGTGILRGGVLSIPRIGTLNAHPGWLPDYRGLSVVAWAVREGRLPGATVHWVDQGVDTGDIIVRRRLRPVEYPSLEAIEQAVAALAVELMVDAVELVAAGTAPRIQQPHDAGRYYPAMPVRLRRVVARAVQQRGLPAGVPT